MPPDDLTTTPDDSGAADDFDDTSFGPGTDIDQDLNSDWSGQSTQQPAQPATTTTVVPPAAPASYGPIPGYQPKQYADPDPNAQPISIGKPQAPPSSGKGELHDFGNQVWAAALQGGQDTLAATSAAARALTGNPTIVGWLEQQRHMLGDHIAATVQDMSPKGQAAYHASFFNGGQTDADGNRIPTPSEVGWGRYIGSTIASLIPAPVLAVTGATLAAAAAPEALTTAAGLAAAGGIYGTLQAGGWYGNFVDAIDKAKPAQLMTSPVYAHAVDQGLSDADARKVLVGQIAPYAATAQFALGAATGAGVGGLLTRGAVGAAGASLAARAGLGAAEGAATLGAQSGGGDVISQAANVSAGLQKEYDPTQTAEALASGALTGAALGAVGGAFHGTGASARTSENPSPNVHTGTDVGVDEFLKRANVTDPGVPQLPPPDEHLALTYTPEAGNTIQLPEGYTIHLPDQTVDEKASQAVEPTPAQAEAGNYQKGHVTIQGMDISVENPRGTVRSGPVDDTTGQPAWQTEMANHYGYIRGTEGPDGEQVDVQLGPRAQAIKDATPAQAAREPVYVVDQIDPATGKFDEHKAFVGFNTALEATHAYDDSFSDGSGPSRRGAVTEMTLDKFKGWLDNGDTTKPLNYSRSDQIKQQVAARKAQLNAQPIPERAETYVTPDTGEVEPETQVGAAPEPQPAPSQMSLEAREESQNQPIAYERENSPTTTVVESPPEKTRAPTTTDKRRVLGDLENKVTAGLMTAAEADRAYGRVTPGTAAGRQRRYPDFKSYIKDRLSQAEDTDAEKALLEQARTVEADRSIPVARRQAQAREINAKLQRVGPDYAQRLRKILDDLEGRTTTSGLRKNRGAPSRSRPGTLFRLAYDQRINRPLREILDTGHEAGTSNSLHEYLKAITNDKVIGVRLPHAVALARRLQTLLPDDVQVMSQETAGARFGLPVDSSVSGQYWRAVDNRPAVITVNHADPGSLVETMLHEGMHAVTDRLLEAMSNDDPHIQAMAEIHNELTNALDQSRSRLTPGTISDIEYALSDIHELHTMLMTSPALQEFASTVTPSLGFRQRMRGLGYTTNAVRNVWQAFTDWVRRVVGLPQGSNSLLDHVLRPLQDITDRAADLNNAYKSEDLPGDPGLRDQATTVVDNVSHALFGKGKTPIVDTIDPKGLGDRARAALLSGATTDGIVKWNRALFQSKDIKANLLDTWRKAVESIAARSKTFTDTYGDQVSKLLADIKGPERDTLAALTTDATLARARLGTSDPAANAHLKTQDQLDALASLQARYNALSPRGKQTYQDLRDYYAKTYAEERTAQLMGMAKTAIPDLTSPQARSLALAMRTRAGIKQLIDSPDKSPVAQAFAQAWDTNRALVRQIAKVHSQGFVDGDYFPLRRFGDYAIAYGTKGTDDYGMERFDRRGDADYRRAELARAGAEPTAVMLARDQSPRSMVPSGVLDELNNALKKSGKLDSTQAEAVRDTFATIMMQHMSHSEAARSRLRRQGIKGASTDIERVLAQDFLSTSARMGYLANGADRSNAMSALRRHVGYLERTGDPRSVTAAQVVNELDHRQPLGDDASGKLTGAFRKFGQLGFVYSLMSPSHALTSTIEAHMNSMSFLGARHGSVRAGLALTKALKDTVPVSTGLGARGMVNSVRAGLKASDWSMSKMVRDRLIANGADKEAMTDLGQRLDNAGLIDHSQARELRRIANPTATNITKGWWGKFMDFNTVGAHAVDVANKWAIAKAAYDLELRKSGDHDTAANYAVETARTAMPNYNQVNKARISTRQGPLGAFGAPLTQFKQYGFHMYSVMANTLRESLHGATREDRMEARKAFAGILATHALMAGSLTLVGEPLRIIGGLYDLFTGADKPHNYENDVRSWMASAMGPELGEVAARGLPHLAGIDIHRRVGLTNLLETPEINSFDAKGFGEAVGAAMTGAAGEDATTIAAGAHSIMAGLMQGDGGKILNGLKAAIPRVVRDPMKAADLADRGVTDSRGRTILPPSRLSTGDVAAQALGFQPARVSEFREGRNAVIEAREEATAARSTALNAFVTASPTGRRDALTKVQDYNRSNPQSPITYSQLLQALKRQQSQTKASPRTFGLQLPNRQAPALEKAGAFANTQ
jgi:Inorganic Pyrophosphatase